MGEKIRSINPVNYRVNDEFNRTTPDEIRDALCRAQAAFPNWRDIGLNYRINAMKQLVDRFTIDAEKIALLQTLEMGMPITDSRESVYNTIAWTDNQIRCASEALKPQMTDEGENYRMVTERCPYGVVAAITPFNFPFFQWAIATVPALLAGNCVVVKPSEVCPLTAQTINDLTGDSILPDGVYNTIYGDGREGKTLLGQTDLINFVRFTGSTEVGNEVRRKAAKAGLPTVLELGGSSPAIVFADANLDEACGTIIRGRMTNAGQDCLSHKRVFVHEDVYPEVVGILTELASSIRVGDPMDPTVTMGPLASRQQLQRTKKQIDDALQKGARVAWEGIVPDTGAFQKPMLIEGVNLGMSVMSQETFGPILPIMPFRSPEQAVSLANETKYGLSAYLYTSDLKFARRVAPMIEAGVVTTNNAPTFGDNTSFSGVKGSWFGGPSDGKEGFKTVTYSRVFSSPIK